MQLVCLSQGVAYFKSVLHLGFPGNGIIINLTVSIRSDMDYNNEIEIS